MGQSADSSREIFRQCLRQADRFIIEGKFTEAKQQLTEAKKIDSRNPFIIAFEERIALFENKINHVHKQPALPKKESEPQKTNEAGEIPAAEQEQLSREILEQNLRQDIEAEFKARYTEELRKAEEQAAKILDEERAVLQQQQRQLQEHFENQITSAKEQLENEFQTRLAVELVKAEKNLSAKHQNEISSVESEAKEKIILQYKEEIDRLKKELDSSTTEIETKQVQTISEREKQLKERYDNQLKELLQQAEESFKKETEKQIRIERERISEEIKLEYDAKLIEVNDTFSKKINEFEIEKNELVKHEDNLKKEHAQKLAESLDGFELKYEKELRTKFEKELQLLENKIKNEYELRLRQEKEKFNQLDASLTDERRAFSLRESEMKKQFELDLNNAKLKFEASHLKNLQTAVEQERAKITEEFEQHLKTELSEAKESFSKLEAVLSQERKQFSAREQELKNQHNQKLLDALRKTETIFREQSAKQLELERERITNDLQKSFDRRLEEERNALARQSDILKSELESAFQRRVAELEEESERRFREQLAILKKNQEQELSQEKIILKQQLENEIKAEYEAKLSTEKERLQKEAEKAIAAEKNRLDDEYKKMLEKQNAQVQKFRSELRKEMEQTLLSRLERIAYEYDHKMELLGARIPETKEQRYEMYRIKMLDCYINGQPSVADARILMQLKELLELTFDEHLAIEADVRLDLYVKRVEKMIVTGDLNVHNSSALENLKQQFNITLEESSRLEQFILASFQRLTKKGRILIVDDDLLLLHSLEDLLNDTGYQVVTAPDIDTALEKLSNTPFDLILSDIKFGASDLDGFKFFKAVQEHPHLRSIPFVFMSALIDGVIIRSGIQLGVDDYITKPMDPDLLIATIEGKLKRFRDIRVN